MKDVLIIGGGLAGLISAIQLAQLGWQVVLLEKKNFPRNKVCGEYISNEVLPYLHSLGIYPLQWKAKQITRFQLTALSGEQVEAPLEMGGFSIRRYTLDDCLYQQAIQNGVEILLNSSVEQVQFKEKFFEVNTRKGQILEAKIVIGAYGKRSNLDKRLNRAFFQDRSHYIGVKQYYEFPFADDLVALHNFEGGYCGVSKVENNWVNVAYLTTKQSLQNAGTVEILEGEILSKNPHLKEVFTKGKPMYEKPFVISNVSFQSKKRVCDHLLMCGDSAGMISPLCGNGMAMAIRSAQIAAGLVHSFLEGKISRPSMEQQYIRQWNQLFRSRLFWGKHLQSFMGHRWVSELTVRGLQSFPFLMKAIIRQTHGGNVVLTTN